MLRLKRDKEITSDALVFRGAGERVGRSVGGMKKDDVALIVAMYASEAPAWVCGI